ncbi:MAG: SRPBCC family protein [Solirubrobacterales bacterium]|nr:SRPBCC family protein [Solirubrobacterales bacterium]
MKTFSKIALGGAAVAWIYHFVLRDPILNWGASNAEVAATLPGDELLPAADGVSTRAITIDAPPSAVWPWIVQIGPYPRGGVYTYDWIENLFGLQMHSTSEVLEEFQHPQLGEEIGFGENKMVLSLLEPQRSIAWRSRDGNWVWSFNLIEDAGHTRFISRNRFRLQRIVDRVGMVPMIPGSLVMERKMLFGIKERAEAHR